MSTNIVSRDIAAALTLAGKIRSASKSNVRYIIEAPLMWYRKVEALGLLLEEIQHFVFVNINGVSYLFYCFVLRLFT